MYLLYFEHGSSLKVDKPIFNKTVNFTKHVHSCKMLKLRYMTEGITL
jgi:hypothetical protein